MRVKEEDGQFTEEFKSIGQTVEELHAAHQAAEDAKSDLHKLWDKIRLRFYVMGSRIEHIFARKYKLEKEHRQFGFTYWDRPHKKYALWNADRALAWLTLPVLVRFRHSNKNGCPSWLDGKEIENVEIGEVRWNEILDEMIYAFHLCIENEIYDIETSNKVDNGLKLYGEYFRALWD